MRSPTGERLWRWALGALVAAAALAAFSPIVDNSFIGWDDKLYIIDNEMIRGLGWSNLRWMLTGHTGGLWQPLTWLSFAADYQLWGLEPWGFHFTNIVLHAAAGVLFYLVCLLLFERARPAADPSSRAAAAALAALFWAIHPLRVESVAWAVERKDTLSGLFWLAAVLFRLKAADPNVRRPTLWEAGSLAAFAASLSAKGAGLILPGVLLVLEIYPLRRLPADPRRWLEKPSRRVLWSLAPFSALSFCGFLFNYAAAAKQEVLFTWKQRGLAWRAGQLFYSLIFYPVKTAWPSRLAAYHDPLPWFGRWSWELFVYVGLALAGIAAASASVARSSSDRSGAGVLRRDDLARGGIVPARDGLQRRRALQLSFVAGVLVPFRRCISALRPRDARAGGGVALRARVHVVAPMRRLARLGHAVVVGRGPRSGRLRPDEPRRLAHHGRPVPGWSSDPRECRRFAPLHAAGL